MFSDDYKISFLIPSLKWQLHILYQWYMIMANYLLQNIFYKKGVWIS